MKKNKMMRLASVLLVLTLLSTSVISGTFAKYVTSADGSDSARVAKWGVTVDISGSLFGEDYAAYEEDANKVETDGSNKIIASTSQSVHSSANDNIVAPGTKSDKGLTLSVSGQPEVASVLTYAQPTDAGGNAIQNETIWLAVGNYGVLVETSNVTADNFADYYYVDNGTYKKATAFDETYTGKWYTLRDTASVSGKTYEPIIWELNDGGPNGTLSTIMGYLVDPNNINAPTFGNGSISYSSNTAINLNVTIHWEWPFEQGHDDADTILGNLMAAKNSTVNYVVVKTSDNYVTCTEPVEEIDYNLNIFFGADITVTQVD